MSKVREITDLGPAMKRLTEKQRAYVLALREVPQSKGREIEAMRRAGYQGDADTLKSNAYRLRHDEKVMAAIKEVALGMMSSEGIGLTCVLFEIAYGDIPSTPSEKMKAIGMIFNRTGMPEISEHKIKVEHTVNNDEAIEKLNKFARVLGVPTAQLLGSMGMEIIDGDFVEADRPLLPAPGGGGLHNSADPAGDGVSADPFAYEGDDAATS